MSNNGELSGQKEKVAAGILGAVLFALIGGIIYVALYKADIFPPLSGLAAAALSFLGFRLFAKKPSLKSVFISLGVAVGVLILFTYLLLAWDCYNAYLEWYSAGQVKHPITFIHALFYGHQFLADPNVLAYYLKQLGLTALFCVIGSVLFFIDGVKRYREQKHY